MIRVLVYDFGIPLFCFIFFSVLIYFGLKTKKVKWKYFLYNSAAIFIAVFIFELYSHISNADNINKNVSYSGSFFDNEFVAGKKLHVGYGPKEDTSFQVSAIRKNNDTIVYEANYSFLNGKRLVPNNNDTSTIHLSFLGGSHIFGDGLNDNQTLPYFVNKFSNKKYNISNYGFSGYGTHQALKIIENNILNQKNLSQSCVIYSFIPTHFRRAAGHTIWDSNGPLYEFENNQLLFKGSFNENRLIKENYLTLRLKTIWENSYLFKSVFYPRVKDKDVIRVSEIINTMNNLLKEKEIKFIIILGRTDFNNKNEQKLHAEL
ncbi:MAG: hypothetical protein JKX68_08355 [Flavobacteriales bacterium]|nr:hypothetical protein [Flavobacteriales bacterium]